ncbi:MAG: hypothetical protein GX575_08365 [Candidatus Anammoximicrobium sp.]|nr:hypothetical protein [Candidatus Anammoximicrobium sp.]
MSRSVLAVAVYFSLTAAFAQAQAPYRGQPHPACGPHTIVSQHHASTAEEGILRGWADVARARALYNLMTEQARVCQAEAYRLQVANEVARTEAYFKMRDLNRQTRFGSHAPSVPRMPVVGQTQPRPAAPRPAASRRSPLETAGVTKGVVCWPKALQDEPFASYRHVVERLVAKNYQRGGLSDQERSTLTQASRAMAGELKNRIRSCSPQEYVDAKQLLIALAS